MEILRLNLYAIVVLNILRQYVGYIRVVHIVKYAR